MKPNGRLNRSLIGMGLTVAMLAGCGGQQGQQAAVPQVAQPAGAGAKSATTGKGNADTTQFTVSGRNIELDGKPFFIKGVDYGNNQIDSYADSNPLDNANEPIWRPDLDAMRAAGVNSVKVYNVTLTSFKPYEEIIGGFNKLRPYETGKINKFLKAAWNNGDHPIYVVLSVFFGGVNVTEPKYLNALNAVYKLMATEYGDFPAVMGVSIGSEINSEEYINQKSWWQNLNKIDNATKNGFTAAGAEKITTTTMVDDNLNTVRAGELAGFKADTWGLDVYRGRTMTNIFNQISSDTQKPVIIAEYGASAAYYPKSSAIYNDSTGRCDNYPEGTGKKPFFGLPPPKPWEDATELPKSGNPQMPFLVNLVKSNANAIYEHRATTGTGVTSGGFYFEWNDEWWKSGWPFSHIGGFEGNKIVDNANFPGCYDDQAWFGLNSDKRNGTSKEPFPSRNPDTRVARPALSAITDVWAQEP
jgi:hypothetical protein